MKILVAEDNPNARQLVHDILDSIGHETILTVDGPSALAAAQANIPDLIIHINSSIGFYSYYVPSFGVFPIF